MIKLVLKIITFTAFGFLLYRKVITLDTYLIVNVLLLIYEELQNINNK